VQTECGYEKDDQHDGGDLGLKPGGHAQTADNHKDGGDETEKSCALGK
jgi:hypothetical protein